MIDNGQVSCDSSPCRAIFWANSIVHHPIGFRPSFIAVVRATERFVIFQACSLFIETNGSMLRLGLYDQQRSARRLAHERRFPSRRRTELANDTGLRRASLSAMPASAPTAMCGDVMIRTYLFEAANVLLIYVPKWSRWRPGDCRRFGFLAMSAPMQSFRKRSD